MKFKNLLFLLLASILSATAAFAQQEGKTVYAFGYATCLGDSTVYLSTIQPLDSAVVKSKSGFLEHRHEYAVQMEQALAAQYNRYFTCAIFFAEDVKKLEKQYTKICHHLEKEGDRKLQKLPLTTFRFSPITDPTIVSH